MDKDLGSYFNDSFIESPIYDNWFKKHYPEKSLLICSPYIKKDAIDKIIELYKLDEREPGFELNVLIRGNRDEFTYSKSSDIAALDSLMAIRWLKRSNIRRISNLHMKAYLVDGEHLLITSGNMTNSGMFVISGKENFEGGISTNDNKIIIDFQNYFIYIWNQSRPLLEFYDELMAAYKDYIEKGYSDRGTLRRLSRERHNFSSHTVFDEIAEENKERIYGTAQNQPRQQIFSLSDIPPVGRLEHLPDTLRIIGDKPDGVTYLELGKELRPIFSDNPSDTDIANRKFGEEKGKFAAFLGLVSVEKVGRNMIFRITNLGRTFLEMSDENRNKLIKDVFFDKPIIVSILRYSLNTDDFDLLEFLMKYCEGATRLTLSRKVGPLKELFALIRNICTDAELKEALKNV